MKILWVHCLQNKTTEIPCQLTDRDCCCMERLEWDNLKSVELLFICLRNFQVCLLFSFKLQTHAILSISDGRCNSICQSSHQGNHRLTVNCGVTFMNRHWKSPSF